MVAFNYIENYNQYYKEAWKFKTFLCEKSSVKNKKKFIRKIVMPISQKNLLQKFLSIFKWHMAQKPRKKITIKRTFRYLLK